MGHENKKQKMHPMENSNRCLIIDFCYFHPFEQCKLLAPQLKSSA